MAGEYLYLDWFMRARANVYGHVAAASCLIYRAARNSVKRFQFVQIVIRF